MRGDDDAVLDWLSISGVERIPAEAGVDRPTRLPVVDAAVVGPQQAPRPAAPAAAS